MRQRLALGVVVVLLAGLVWFLFNPPLLFVDTGEYERTNVTVYGEDGDPLATVDVRVADTRDKRRVGLSRTDSLEFGEGMLFVHGSEGSHTYVMRNMSFALDIIFADSDGRITTIHHAPVDGDSYDGRGKFVLEVPRGWANETGVTAGARIEIPSEIDD